MPWFIALPFAALIAAFFAVLIMASMPPSVGAGIFLGAVACLAFAGAMVVLVNG